ncbi:sigma-54-dependent transcriptional regulator [Variovorax boronicumulans]
MNEEPNVFYVEDDPAVRLGSMQAMQLAGLRVRSFGSAEQLMPHLFEGFPGVLVTDIKLPGADGLALLGHTLRIDSALPVILVTGHGDISLAVQAMRQGAYDFIEKPYSPQQLNDVVQRALEKRSMSLEIVSLKRKLQGYQAIESKMIGDSSAMQRLRKLLLDLAATDADVLILGETGSGKELVARCLHDHGRRKGGNFVAVNCGGMPEALFESEMFGHEAGAFTSAAKRRIGKIEHAHAGTLFLDEIESMPQSLQVKLLRTVQERQFERLGSNNLQSVDCRIVAATKVDLLELAKEQKFRSDLYYRLGVAIVEVPPLRERREDIPLLFTHFMMQAGLRYERAVPTISTEQLRGLMMHSWPGNVRELRNAADRFVLGVGMERWLEDTGNAPHRSLDEQVSIFERHLILEALNQNAGRVAAASESLLLPKKTLYSKMQRYGISTDSSPLGN